jgi:hypothetical protein
MEALHHQHLRYGVREQQHEAGYDAFLTAQVFLALAAEMSGRGKVRAEMKLHVKSGSPVKTVGQKSDDIWNEGLGGESAYDKFHGGIFKDWEGLLSINGTMEGFIKLDKGQRVSSSDESQALECGVTVKSENS